MKKNAVIATLGVLAILLLIFGLYQKARADRLERMNFECKEVTNRLKAEVDLITTIACIEKTKSLEDQLKATVQSNAADQQVIIIEE